MIVKSVMVGGWGGKIGGGGKPNIAFVVKLADTQLIASELSKKILVGKNTLLAMNLAPWHTKFGLSCFRWRTLKVRSRFTWLVLHFLNGVDIESALDKTL